MKTKYMNKHAESSWMSNLIKEFFAGKGLPVKEYVLRNGIRIVAYAENLASVQFAVVEFQVGGQEILVNYLPWGKKERAASTSLLASTLPLFGGGIFISRDSKSKDFMQKIEREFWDFLDSHIVNLS